MTVVRAFMDLDNLNIGTILQHMHIIMTSIFSYIFSFKFMIERIHTVGAKKYYTLTIKAKLMSSNFSLCSICVNSILCAMLTTRGYDGLRTLAAQTALRQLQPHSDDPYICTCNMHMSSWRIGTSFLP